MGKRGRRRRSRRRRCAARQWRRGEGGLRAELWLVRRCWETPRPCARSWEEASRKQRHARRIKEDHGAEWAELALSSITQDRVSWLDHGTHDLARIKRSGRLGQLRNQCWVEIGANSVTDHIKERERVAHKVSTARQLIAGGEQDLNLSGATRHIIGAWRFANTRVGEGTLTAHMPVSGG